MFFYAGCRCPVCGQLFTENDDIVACPQCGTPHHRACWQSLGHCVCEERHGEGYQWERETPASEEPAGTAPEETADGFDEDEDDEEEDPSLPRSCPRCGFSNPHYAEFCSRCGAPLTARAQKNPYASSPTGYGEYAPFRAAPADPCGGVDAKEEIRGVPAEELAAGVRLNTAYYLPVFSRMEQTGSRVRWNWAAFLLGPYWLFFRKCYLSGGILLGLTALFRCSMAAIVSVWVNPLLSEVTDYAAASQAMMQALMDGKIPMAAIGLTYLSLFLLLAVHLFCGLWGNRLYLASCAGRIRKLKTKNPYGYKVFLPSTGGVSLFFGTLSYAAVYLLQNLIAYFLM